MTSHTRLTVSFPTGGFFGAGSWHRVLDAARLADQAGVDTLRLPDHVVMGERSDRYSWGAFPYPVDVPWIDPLTAIAAMAAVTERVRFCTSILIAPLRPAPLLAKMAATIDVLSAGRIELGVGTGWQREEFEAAGIDFAQRGQLLTDTIGACRALWSPGAASFASPSFNFDRIWCEPKPVQPGGIPVFFSGTLTERNIRRIVTLGDGWLPIMDATTDDVARGAVLLRERWADAGRDPSALRIHVRLPVLKDGLGRADVGRTVEGARPLIEMGITDLQLASVPYVSSPDGLEQFFAEVGKARRQLRAVSG
ncbi:MAG: TIGR03619 family F420-dependent LLM class oxidoreductase [Acidimicrobiales bacterium]